MIADWYFDFVSPFAYLQSEQLASLAPAISIRYTPVLFAGLLGANGQKGPAEIAGQARVHLSLLPLAGKTARHSAQVSAGASVQSAAAAAARDRVRLVARGACTSIFRFVWRDGRLPRSADRVGGARGGARHARRQRAHRVAGGQGRACAATPTRRSRAACSAFRRSRSATSFSGAPMRRRWPRDYVAAAVPFRRSGIRERRETADWSGARRRRVRKSARGRNAGS